MEFLLHSDLKKELLVYATTQVNFTVKMMSKRSQTQKAIRYMIPFIYNSRTNKTNLRSEVRKVFNLGQREGVDWE